MNEIRNVMQYVSLSVAPVEHAHLIKWFLNLKNSRKFEPYHCQVGAVTAPHWIQCNRL